MIAVLIILAVIIVANVLVWGSVLLRWLGVRLPVSRAPFVEPHKGRHVASQPRTDLPRRKPIAGRQPWQTQAFPVPTDEQTLALYRGDWGTMPAERVLEGERLASRMLT